MAASSRSPTVSRSSSNRDAYTSRVMAALRWRSIRCTYVLDSGALEAIASDAALSGDRAL
jgi:hypothetical protein